MTTATPNEPSSPVRVLKQPARLLASPSKIAALDERALSLLLLIHFAGGAVPSCLFDHALTWDESGETRPVSVPTPAVLGDP